MADVVTVILSFPTVIFSGMVGLSLFYWVFVIVGAVDLDLFDGLLDGAAEGALDGAMDGAVEGALEAADGAVEGAFEAADGAVEGAFEAADGAVEGAFEAADGALEAAGEGAEALDVVNAVHQGSAMLSMLKSLRLRDAPITVVASMFSLWAWLISSLSTDALMGQLGGELPLLYGLGVFALAAPVGLLLTSLTVRPIAPLFHTEEGPRRRDLIGSTCEVTTGRVDHRFGQAVCTLGGADAVVQVRCDHQNELRRGSEALVVNFDERRDAFMVEPLA